MSFLERLKTIGIHVGKNLACLKITVNIDKSTKVVGSTIMINPRKLSEDQREGLQEILRTVALEESAAILDDKYSETIEDAVESLPEIEPISKKFAQIIPPADIPLLNASLYLKRRFESGAQVSALKDQIIRVYGPRGRNFANLCSAGYLEDWFWPLYEHLLRSHPGDPVAARARFQIIYNSIVNELPWTEFVSTKDSPSAIKTHIIDKMTINIQNGVRFMNIHGLGEPNVKKIKSILPEVILQTGASVGRMEQETNRIFIRLETLQKLPP